MIGDLLIPTGPDYGKFKRGCYGAIIHDLETPRSFKVRQFMGRGTYPDNQGVSPHTMSDTTMIGQILDEFHAGAHVGGRGNPLFVAFEVTGYAKWTEAEWMADISNLLNQARAVANLWKAMGWKTSDLKWGSGPELIEARRRYDAGLPCIAPRLWTHNDVSEFLGGTNHWDPGRGFPFKKFLEWCHQFLVGNRGDGGTTPNVPDNPTSGGAEKAEELVYTLFNIQTTGNDGTQINAVQLSDEVTYYHIQSIEELEFVIWKFTEVRKIKLSYVHDGDAATTEITAGDVKGWAQKVLVAQPTNPDLFGVPVSRS